MKSLIVILLSVAFTAKHNSPDTVVFVASTPCSQGTRPLPGISTNEKIELIKWQLKFVGNPGKEKSGTYILNCDYGMPKQGSRDFINEGKHLYREGKWAVVKGTKSYPAAIIYCLDPDKPQSSVSFLRLNENLIHLLDSHQQLMIGNGAWSYTLNRIQP